MQHRNFTRRALMAAISLALMGSLSACGGGGGNVRPDPVVNPPPPPPPSNPPPTQPTYNWPYDNALVPTAADKAHADGFTGKGVKVAVFDSGIDPSLPDFKGRSFTFHSFLDPTSTANDPYGHGSITAGLIAGAPTGDFEGGVAPDVDLYVGQICDGNNSCALNDSEAKYFYDQGVRLFNYSLGGSTTNGGLGLDPADLSFYSTTFQPLVDGGALFVWAAGNGGVGTLDEQAAAPHYYPDLEKGWLVAVNVAVDHDTGKITGLYVGKAADGSTVSSSDCGIAADWCLAAPGYVYAPAPSTSIFSKGYAVGTSDSTAIITGVAALVSQAYPWMDGHNIQQTLLTTATHLQDNSSGGVDATYNAGTVYTPNSTYGWGLVNAERAVHGPGQFVGDFTANIGDYKSEFSNVISGAGSLTLNGNAGVLTLSADNLYTGGTTINGGTLLLSGSVKSDVTVNGGALAGDGVVHASVNNVAGTVASVNTAAGKGLTIEGNYTVGANGTTSVALGHTITVGKTASLDGTLALTPPESTYTPKSTETLLSASQINGQFATTDDSGLIYYTAKVNYGTTSVTADLTRTSVTTASEPATPVEAATAQGLEGAMQYADAWSQSDYAGHKAFLDTAAQFLSATSVAQAQSSVASLSGELHGTVNALEAATSGQVDHAVALRQNGTLDGKASVWVQALNSDAGLSEDGFASAKARGNGTLAGMEIPVGDHFVGGVFGGKSRSADTLSGAAGRADERDTFAGVYGSYKFDGGAYLAGRATWTHAGLDTQRTALIGTEAYSVASHRTDGVGRVTIEAGERIGNFTPYVAAAALRINQAGFTEQGANGFGLTADAQRHSATLADLGLRWNKAFEWSGGMSYLTAYAAIERVLNGQALDFTAALAGAPDATFTVASESLPRTTGRIGATFDTRINDQWDWYFDVDAQGDKGRSHAFEANAGVRFSF